MNKKLIISLGVAAILSSAAYADTTIYTDGIGRMHFLGRDAANSTVKDSRYSNSANQDLTRKLYENAESGMIEDTSYSQHPLKNYENTFPDTRFTQGYWKKAKNYSEDEDLNTKSVKATTTATKGQTDYSGLYSYGSTFLDNSQEPSKTEVKPAKKHWWNKK